MAFGYIHGTIISEKPGSEELWENLTKQRDERNKYVLCFSLTDKFYKCKHEISKCPYSHDTDITFYNQHGRALTNSLILFFDHISGFAQPLCKIIADYCRLAKPRLPLSDAMETIPLSVAPLFECPTCAHHGFYRLIPKEHVSNSIYYCEVCHCKYEKQNRAKCRMLIKDHEGGDIIVEEVIPGQGSPNELIKYDGVDAKASTVCYDCFEQVGLTNHDFKYCEVGYDSVKREEKGCAECKKAWLYDLTYVDDVYDDVICPAMINDVLCPFYKEDEEGHPRYLDVQTGLKSFEFEKGGVIKKRIQLFLDHLQYPDIQCIGCYKRRIKCYFCRGKAVYETEDYYLNNEYRKGIIIRLCGEKDCLSVFGNIAGIGSVLKEYKWKEGDCQCGKLKKEWV